MGDIRAIRTPSVERTERIVVLLEELLADAKAGKTSGLFVFAEDTDGRVTHSRDGMPDATIVFWLELVKRRILEAYE
jgi:hypothetical protein